MLFNKIVSEELYTVYTLPVSFEIIKGQML